MAEAKTFAPALDVWLTRAAVLAIVGLQLLIVNDLTFIPKWILPTLEVALLAPLSIATAWSLGKTTEAEADGRCYPEAARVFS